MDRSGALLENVIETMKSRLDLEPLVTQIPLGEAETFHGVIDLINMNQYIWKDEMGNTVEVEEVVDGHPNFEMATQGREKLIESLANFDEKLAVSWGNWQFDWKNTDINL